MTYANTPTNSDDVIDSRDVIARIEELNTLLDGEEDNTDYDDVHNELEILTKLQEEAEASPDWEYGETLIRKDYFVTYIKELIDDCYPIPDEIKNRSGEWPYRHIKIDYEAAADEAKYDYIEVDFDGVTYFIRA